MESYVKIGTLGDVAAFQAQRDGLGIEMPCDVLVEGGSASPLAQPLAVNGLTIPNRFAIHPMEGWDGTTDGRPSDHGRRRWRRFGESGAGLIWGGEAVSVRPNGRANPNQLMLNNDTKGDIAGLRTILLEGYHEAMGATAAPPVIGLQLTHSGRWSKPNSKTQMEPMIPVRNPILDRKQKLPADYPIWSDGDLRGLQEDYVRAAKLAHEIGYDFVDIKHCHGYLLHELLSAHTRTGDFGGDFANRTRFIRDVVQGIRSVAPGLEIGVRLSAFDFAPYKPNPATSVPGKLGEGIPDVEGLAAGEPFRWGFGIDTTDPTRYDLTETFQLFDLFTNLAIRMVNITAGSPYYNPHIQRPAIYPPSDGYMPPEDPLVGVARQMGVCRELKARYPQMMLVGSAYTYLQEFLPNVAQAAVREGWIDSIGLGRMVLSYPELPRDVIADGGMQKKRICRTFSDCTTAPRNGLISGCYPLDSFYKKSAEFQQLAMIKKGAKANV